MKKNLFNTVLISILMLNALYSQSKYTKGLIERIDHNYTYENNMIKYEKVLDFADKSEDVLYEQLVSYIDNFTESDLRISSQNPDSKKLKVVGLHKDFYSDNVWGVNVTLSASYKILAEVKDNKIRIQVFPDDYFKVEDGSALSSTLGSLASSVNNYDLSNALASASMEVNQTLKGDLNVSDVYPINSNSSNKNFWGKAYYYLNNHIVNFMDAMKAYIDNYKEDSW